MTAFTSIIKKLQLVILVLLFSFLITNCTNEESVSLQQGKNIEQEDLNIIKSYGFDISTVKDCGDFYLVEGDVCIDKSSLRKLKGQNISKQILAGDLISFSKQKNIRVRVSNNIPSTGEDNWRPEIQEAIKEWNNLGSNISLVYVTSDPHDILIDNDSDALLPDNQIASAFLPQYGNPGDKIKINLDFRSNMQVSSAQKKYNMVHEIGHCLGFGHTNWSGIGESSSGSSVIAGTPNSGTNPDPQSVMNGGTALNSWNGFSNFDKIALYELYPQPIEFYKVEHTAYNNGLTAYIKVQTECSIQFQSNILILPPNGSATVKIGTLEPRVFYCDDINAGSYSFGETKTLKCGPGIATVSFYGDSESEISLKIVGVDGNNHIGGKSELWKIQQYIVDSY